MLFARKMIAHRTRPSRAPSTLTAGIVRHAIDRFVETVALPLCSRDQQIDDFARPSFFVGREQRINAFVRIGEGNDAVDAPGLIERSKGILEFMQFSRDRVTAPRPHDKWNLIGFMEEFAASGTRCWL
jgi:hypothetical protein